MREGKRRPARSIRWPAAAAVWRGLLAAAAATGLAFLAARVTDRLPAGDGLDNTQGTQDAMGREENKDETQPDRVSLPGVVITLGMVLIAVGILMWLSWSLLRGWNPDLSRGPLRSKPDFPARDATAAQDLRTFRAHEDSLLNTYGWADSAAGKVRIPVDSAMALAIRRGMALVGEARGPDSLPVLGTLRMRPGVEPTGVTHE